MRFLVDTNLPPTVATIIAALGHDARHTSDVGLEKAKDREIWQRDEGRGFRSAQGS